MTGFVVFWSNRFVIDIGVSPGIFSGYVAWLGGAQQALPIFMGSHSHAIVMCMTVGLAAVVAKRFNVLSLTGWPRRVAKLGMWVGVTGVIALSTMLILEAYTTVFPAGSNHDRSPPGSVSGLGRTRDTSGGFVDLRLPLPALRSRQGRVIIT